MGSAVPVDCRRPHRLRRLSTLTRRIAMSELLVDFITSLDGYGSAEGWPGWWGLEGPEYLAWLDQRPDRDHTVLMGATTYRLMSSMAGSGSSQHDEATQESDAMAGLTRLPK